MMLCGVDRQSKDERRGGSRAGKVEFVPVQARRVGTRSDGWNELKLGMLDTRLCLLQLEACG